MKNTDKLLTDIFNKTKSTHTKLDKFSDILDKYWKALQRLEKAYFGLSTIVFLIILWPLLSKYIDTVKRLYESSTSDFKLNLILVIPLTAIIALAARSLLIRIGKKQEN